MNRKTSTLISIGISAVLLAIGIWFLYNHHLGLWPEKGQWAMQHYGMMGGGMGIVMIIFWIVLIGAFALLITGIFNGIRNTDSDVKEKSDVPEILKTRYARGEINKAEYDNIRKDLGF